MLNPNRRFHERYINTMPPLLTVPEYLMYKEIARSFVTKRVSAVFICFVKDSTGFKLRTDTVGHDRRAARTARFNSDISALSVCLLIIAFLCCLP